MEMHMETWHGRNGVADVSRRGFPALVAALSLAGCAARSAQSSSSVATSSDESQDASDEASGPCGSGVHHATIEAEGYGAMQVSLNASVAPITVANFAGLVEQGFYDGLAFHRVVRDFMIQGGDPAGDSTGGSGTTIKGEFSANGVENSIAHVRGTLSMARGQGYDSASSQFFIVQKGYPSLNGNYAAFGHVTDGMDIVDAVVDATADKGDSNGLLPQDVQPRIASIRMAD
jgi:peptidyl-prolyl cis-trans isomerase B (cyclophilin B)